MPHRPARGYRRRGSGFLFVILLLPFVVLAVLYVGLGSLYAPKGRLTAVLLTSPLEVVSFDPTNASWTFIEIPTDAYITGVHGLGEYSVEGLWKLAGTQGSPSGILMESLTDELGIPVERYLGKKGALWQEKESDERSVALLITFRGIVSYLSGSFDTNLTLPQYIALKRALDTREESKSRVVALSEGNGLSKKQASDNSTFLRFDRQQFDRLTEGVFENQTIRKERLRLVVFNTTGRPFLGSRVGRILTRLGMIVAAVGNADPRVDSCELSGTKEHLESETGRAILTLFSCVPNEKNDQEQGDLTVKIGSMYERKFLPNP